VAAFTYTAINATGGELTGEIHARDAAAAHDALRVRGLLALDLKERTAGAEGLRGAVKKVKQRSLQVFSRQFATMIQSGLNVVAALAILEEQTEDRNLAEVIADVRGDVEGGLLLSEAMGRHPKVFSNLYISMVEAGEAAGILDLVLERVATQIEKEMKIRRRVKSALVYPITVLAFAFVVLTALLMFLVPVFTKIFEDLGGELPMLTQIVVTASDAVRGYWYIIFPLIGLAIWGFLWWKRTHTGRQLWDRFRVRVPFGIGRVVLKVGMARFTRTLASLVGAGVDIIRALEITGQTAGNTLIEHAVVDVRERVQQGASIAQPLAEHPVFPPMVSHMVRVGEETGELEKMLGKIADFYEDEVDSSIATLTSIIEPLMMILVGVMVGVIIIAMYLPMFKLLTLIQ
jgi:type IV pilus assembly protein PilC